MRLRRVVQKQKALAVSFSLLLPLVAASATAPPTVAQALRSYGIRISEPDLIVALRDSRPMVRALASAELSELKAVTALPAISDAAVNEQQDLVQAEMFESALGLGSIPALQSLTTICLNPARRGDARLVAARALFGKGDHACFGAIADMMLPSEEAADRIGAWYLLAQLPDRTKQETKLVLERILPALSEVDPHIRLEASTSLRMLHDPSASEGLRTAISSERDENVREQMQEDLTSLSVNKR